MKSGTVRSWCLIAAAFALVSLCIPTLANESGLLGVQIGATPKDLTRVYGSPYMIVTSGMNTLKLRQPVKGDPADWARAVMPASLGDNQQMWIYRLSGANKAVLAAGFVIKGKGPDAYITDVIAASIAANPKVKTERGVRLGDDLKRVLLLYGYPPLIQPYQAQLSTTAGGRTLTAGGAMMPSFGASVMRPGAGGGPGAMSAGPGMMGGGPGMMGMGMPGMMGGAGGPGMMRPGAGAAGRGAIGSGTGPVAPAGSTTTVTAAPGSQVLVVDQRPVTFTDNCVILYDGMAFTLYKFKVVRIQVTQ